MRKQESPLILGPSVPKKSEIDAALQYLQGDTSAIKLMLEDLMHRTQNLEAINRDLQATVVRLEERNKLQARWRFGHRSERLTMEELGQLALALGADPNSADPLMPIPLAPEERDDEPSDDDVKPKPKNKNRKKHAGRLELPVHLRREVKVVNVPDDERTCLCCGEEMEPILPVYHESLEYIPEELWVEVTSRERLACKKKCCQGDINTAERPEDRMKTRAGASFLAALIESKCDDGMTITRISQRFGRLGYEIPVNTLYSNWAYATDLLIPVADAVMGAVADHSYVGLDDTRLAALDTKKGGKKMKGHLWGVVAKELNLIAYRFTETWEAVEVADLIMSFKGHVQVDDYKGYSSLRRKFLLKPDDVDKATFDLEGNKTLVDSEQRLGCMMHARRKFYTAWELGDKRSAAPLELIRKIYEFEATAKKDQLDHAVRGELRGQNSLPLFDELSAWCETMKGRVMPSTRLGAAIDYFQQQENFLRRCFENGRFEIDNGEIERCLREPCIGRKNFLHAGSVDGAHRLAAAYTLVQCCQMLGINAREYLIDILVKLATPCRVRDISSLMPHAWAAARGLSK